MALILLFTSLRSGGIMTKTQHDSIIKAKDQYAAYLEAYIVRLEQRNDRLDDRNDVLARGQERAIKVAETAGMVNALPAETAERLTR